MARFARFAQTISRTSPTAACSTQIARPASPTIASCSGCSLERVVFRARRVFRRDMALGAPARSPQFSRKAFSSVCAACGVTPSFSRPMTLRRWLLRI